MPPAAARVVLTVLKTTDGLEFKDSSFSAHFDLSLSCKASSFGDCALVILLDTVLTEENGSEASSVANISEPTAPLEPKTAAVDIFKVL
ncbi:hypothetical protein N7533_008264 [Penicillium manginii]|uniref:uncharacterized protein n=1 Tax=Penicillium manginii TaxID=203109 RepID=UPI0025485EAF|nr:uncharacterized protein N7533_008264 [Penicillium manginii]KAJ5751236.1 hypothetical protein N7533_008264 [Penicillium manginii]